MLQAQSQQSRIWIGLAAAAIGSVALIGCGGGGDTAGDTSQQPQATGGGGAKGGAGGPVTNKMGGGGLPGGAGAAQQQVATVKPTATNVPFKARRDPFSPWFNTIPPPPNVLTLVEPVRIALAGTTAPEVQPGVEIQEAPTRRVAGILTGNGVYALLDGGPKAEVVKPGDLLDDGYQVVKIDSNSVTLRKKVASQTYTQVVPLTDAGGTSLAAAPGMGGGAGPGFGPGFGRGGGGGPARAGTSGAGGSARGAGN
jgi:hypothetical protein